jgi:hypothetical protein
MYPIKLRPHLFCCFANWEKITIFPLINQLHDKIIGFAFSLFCFNTSQYIYNKQGGKGVAYALLYSKKHS